MNTISEYRQKIEKIDEELLRLLAERCECSQGIGTLKRTSGQPILDSDRETMLLDQYVAKAASTSLSSSFIRAFFTLIFEESRRHQL